MGYTEWKLWLRSLPWSLRWFPILVIFRPVIDQFWELKHISPFLSPLYWVGILTPIICFSVVFRYHSGIESIPNKIFKFWTFLVAINSIFILIVYPSLIYLILILKITLPVFLFFFLRLLILSKIDLLGILTAFMYSCGIVLLFFVYELIFGARSVEITRKTLERYEGGFADVMNYAIYAISGFVIVCYFYFQKTKGPVIQKLLPTIITLLISMVILGRIYHTTSFIALSVLIALALFRIFKKTPSIGILFIITLGIIYITFGEKLKKDSFDPLVRREIILQERGGNERRQFNGRMGRWMDRWGVFSQGNVFGKVFGSGVGFFASSEIIGISVHNDYLRIIFFTGFLGLIFYLLFYLSLFTRRKYLDEGEVFLLEAALIIVIIFSITTLPTMYPPFMYFLLSIFSYVSLPPEQLINTESNNYSVPGNNGTL